jgi:hypothetical protein
MAGECGSGVTTGTSLILVKQALVTALRARPGLDGVQVLFAADDFLPGDDHVEDEAIWFGDTEWIESEIQVWNTGTKKIDEVYAVDWVVQVVKADGSLQEAADVRARALLVELQQALAETPQVSAEVFWGLLRMRRHATGQVLSGPGHGSRFEGVIEVKARLAP